MNIPNRWRALSANSFAADLLHALRRSRLHPGFAATAVLTLALGIAATTSLYSVVDTVLLRPLSWPQPERLVVVHAVVPERLNSPALAETWNRAPLSWANWRQLVRSPTFEKFGVWYPLPHEFGEQKTEIVPVLYVSSGLLPVFGMDPVLGRNFSPAEDEAESSSTAIISHEAWQRLFAGRADILGQPVTLGLPKTIVGVLRPLFKFQGQAPQFLLPIGEMAERGRYNDFLRGVGRLAPGVSMAAASTTADLAVSAGSTKDRRSARVVSLRDEQVGDAARPLWLLFGAAALLLVVACSNVAGLLMGDARARRHEIAVRTALGGSRMRLLRQLTVEHALLAGVAASVGLLLAVWLTPIVVAVAPDNLPRLEMVRVDARIAGFAFVIGGLTILLFGLVPALILARTDIRQILAEGSRQTGLGRHLGQRAVVAVEIAMALMLLVAASLFGETIFRLTSRPLGFDPSKLAVVSFNWTGDPSGELGRDLMRRLRSGEMDRATYITELTRQRIAGTSVNTETALTHLAAIPGVLAAGAVSEVPFSSMPIPQIVRAHGRPPGEDHLVQRQVVNDTYFAAMRIPVVRGRGFDLQDRPDNPVVVVSTELERRLFDGNAVGKRLVKSATPQLTHEIIGVVANVKQREFSDDDLSTVYWLDRQGGGDLKHLLVRSAVDAISLLPRMRQTLQDYDPRMVVSATTTMDGLVAESVAEERLRALLSGVFGSVALLLAAIGLYGLAARRVVERRRELGIRMALGARPADVRALVFRDAAVMIAIGLAVGLPAALGVSRIARTFLYGVSATAPHVFFMAAGVLAAAAMTATLVPALRASRIDPTVALREH